MTRVGFIGCGGIMEEHYKHLSGMCNVKMVGHCDVDAERAKSAAERYGGEAFPDFIEMYDKAKPRAVFIAVPPFAHGAIEEAAAERGIHLFIEKPIALDAATAKRIASALQKARVLTSVGYCFRYYDTVAVARRMLKGKAISLVNGHWNGGMPEVWWWRRMDKSGGQIIEQTTHLFDLLRYLCGDVAEVHAVAAQGCMTKIKDYDVDDSSVVSLRLKNGATACVTSTCVMNHGGRVALEIITPEATFHLNGGVLEVTESDKTTTYRPNGSIYEEEARAFIEAVQSGKRSRIKSTYADAVKTFLVTCAANESIHSGIPVKP